jgi:glutathione S-transferase
MKFYYSTGTCSTACHIALEEAGAKFEGVEVSWQRNLNVEALDKVNPLGAVPALVSDTGVVVTQNAAVLEMVADLHPKARLLAAPGSWERAEIQSWVAFVSSDLQKAFQPIYRAEDMTTNAAAQAEIVAHGREGVRAYLKHVDERLKGREFIAADRFTIADAYLFTIVGWTSWNEIDLAPYANLTRYMARIKARPAVHRVLEREDMLD